MKHFDYVEWLLYKNKLIKKERQIEMEDHLYKCDHCMKVFISLIGEDEIEAAGTIISEDFTKNTLDSIKTIRSIGKKAKKKPGFFNDTFLYYAAVASVTIVLTAGGIFSSLVDSVPKNDARIITQENKVDIGTIYNFSQQVANMTSNFVDNLDFKIVKEE